MASEPQSFSSASRSKRPSIGMANLTDRVAPLRHAGAVANASKKTIEKATAMAPPPFLPPRPSPAPSSSSSADKRERIDSSETTSHIREASPVSLPPVPTPAPVPRVEITAADLFDAIANGTFFDVISRHSVELSTSVSPSTTDVAEDAIDVNVFRDAVHGKSLLHQACKHGDLHVVKCLLYHGADVLAQCHQGRTALHDVVSSSQRVQHALSILKTLHDHDARASCWWTPTARTSCISRRSTAASTCCSGARRCRAFHSRSRRSAAAMRCTTQRTTAASTCYAGCSSGRGLASTRSMPTATATRLRTSRDSPTCRRFLDDASSLAPCPSRLHCIGADGCSLGIAWAQEPASEDPLVADVLAPLWYELEYCEKPSGLRRTSALMAMLMLSSSAAAAAATSSASSYLLNWTRLDVLLAPDASEYWLAGLESDPRVPRAHAHVQPQRRQRLLGADAQR
ncbi:hypothetical protein PINS_up023726 [Pythium insidiosum]|nr:hypothetical protein PINS_up023726 [Pythium insidiosum]